MRDLVRCRETLQREVLKSRHYILKFLARRGFVYREGTNWRQAHYDWLRQLAARDSPLAAEDREVFGEYLGLLEYKLSRRDELDRRIGALALTPALAPAVAPCSASAAFSSRRRWCSPRRSATGGASPRRGSSWPTSGSCRAKHSSGDRERRGSITKAGNSALPPCAGAGRVGLSLPAEDRGRPQGAATRTVARRDRARVEGAASLAHALSAARVSPPCRRSRSSRWRVSSWAFSGR